jgi:hypothetical protein
MAESRNTFFLPADTQITLTFDALSSGYYSNIGDPGDVHSEVTTISASQVKVIGPFTVPKHYEVVLTNGSYTSASAHKINYSSLAITPEANAATIGNSATGTQIATAVNALIAALIAKGLMSAP